MRIARNQAQNLQLAASTASTTKVLELLQRDSLHHFQDQTIPCCAQVDDLPQLPARLTTYQWQDGEASSTEVDKGRR